MMVWCTVTLLLGPQLVYRVGWTERRVLRRDSRGYALNVSIPAASGPSGMMRIVHNTESRLALFRSTGTLTLNP